MGTFTAIDRVTFRVDKGSSGLFGTERRGKTTTRAVLTSFISPTEGTARVAGFDCAEQPEEVKKPLIGYLPETPGVPRIDGGRISGLRRQASGI